jgi:hypothetical protein
MNEISLMSVRRGADKSLAFPICSTTERIFLGWGKEVVCETRSLTLKEEPRLRVFENRVLRRIFDPKRDEVTAGWRKLHNEELHNLYSSPSTIRMTKIRRIRWEGHVARMGEKRNAYRILVGKPEGKRPLGR